uniref:uncharacterized protein LOC122589811 isoform X1 n=2 Tax=Erigeron canadensis TaxID=72917 RepID=UPI001CB8A9BD|nr:uncharacterized protein LOC122589811 isoform X1 [Erigeron canadensis]
MVKGRQKFYFKHHLTLNLDVVVLVSSITLPPLIHVLKRKSLRMLSFKAGIQDNKEIMYDAQELQNIESPVTVESNGTIAGSVAVKNLFKSWLTLLRMPSPHQPAEGMLEGPFLHNIVEAEDSVQDSGRGEILKIVWCDLLGLHSTIKITAIIFIPMYLAVSMKYGAEVVKELAPLWTGGPLIVAAYATMIQLISSLYIFSFRQSVKLLKKSPMVYDYVAGGKLNDLMIPVARFWSLGNKEMSKRMLKDFHLWVVDICMDYVESIWPSYCKLIRFLKRANFI